MNWRQMVDAMKAAQSAGHQPKLRVLYAKADDGKIALPRKRLTPPRLLRLLAK